MAVAAANESGSDGMLRYVGVRGPDYFFDGQGAPQGAQAPAKSSGDTARPLDGLLKWLPTTATSPSTTTMMYTVRMKLVP
jgi:hypothetical protein